MFYRWILVEQSNFMLILLWDSHLAIIDRVLWHPPSHQYRPSNIPPFCPKVSDVYNTTIGYNDISYRTTGQYIVRILHLSWNRRPTLANLFIGSPSSSKANSEMKWKEWKIPLKYTLRLKKPDSFIVLCFISCIIFRPKSLSYVFNVFI